jgi:hypothetical protein
LYELGYQVVGLEGFETPILEFFEENGLKYEKETQGNVACYSVKCARI